MYEQPCIRIIQFSELDLITASYDPEVDWEDENVDSGGWT